jgi:hypothetical protein
MQLRWLGTPGTKPGSLLSSCSTLVPNEQVITVVNTVHADEDTPVAKREYEESEKRFSALMEQAISIIR